MQKKLTTSVCEEELTLCYIRCLSVCGYAFADLRCLMWFCTKWGIQQSLRCESNGHHKNYVGKYLQVHPEKCMSWEVAKHGEKIYQKCSLALRQLPPWLWTANVCIKFVENGWVLNFPNDVVYNGRQQVGQGMLVPFVEATGRYLLELKLQLSCNVVCACLRVRHICSFSHSFLFPRSLFNLTEVCYALLLIAMSLNMYHSTLDL